MTADRYDVAVIETVAAAVVATAAAAVVIVVVGDAVAVGSVVLCARPSVVPSSAMRVVWCPPRHVPDALHWHWAARPPHWTGTDGPLDGRVARLLP